MNNTIIDEINELNEFKSKVIADFILSLPVELQKEIVKVLMR